MNLLLLFIGGLCLLTGSYGLYQSGVSLLLVLAVAWGSLLIGLELGGEIR